MARKPTPAQSGPAQSETAQSETGETEAAAALALVPTVIVRGPRQGRRRSARQFGAEPVSIPLDHLREAELAALHADPLLSVTVVDAPH